jgi:hypothetical protein
MDFCDKCGQEIDILEPCIKVNYGFINPENSFSTMEFLYIHVDCFDDVKALKQILEIFDKN